MEQKNPDNHIDDAPGTISDTGGPTVERRRRDYDQVAEKVAPTREYTLSHSRIIAETAILDTNVDMSVVSPFSFPLPYLTNCTFDNV